MFPTGAFSSQSAPRFSNLGSGRVDLRVSPNWGYHSGVPKIMKIEK